MLTWVERFINDMGWRKRPGSDVFVCEENLFLPEDVTPDSPLRKDWRTVGFVVRELELHHVLNHTLGYYQPPRTMVRFRGMRRLGNGSFLLL